MNIAGYEKLIFISVKIGYQILANHILGNRFNYRYAKRICLILA